jgi:RNA polymerase sigma-70 factor (sigma-E family)
VPAAGDLEELVRLHYQGLVRLAYVLCGDPAEAEDIVGDVLARAWPRLSRGKVDEPGAYLRRGVVNAVASWRRHRFVVRREELRRRPEPPPSDAEGQTAERDRLWTALRALPVAQRQVVVLRFLEDLSEAETAATLGVASGTVKSRTARALEALRRALAEDVDV